MKEPESTCWTLVEHAAAGQVGAREEFGRRYLPVVRAYLHARWSKRLSAEELEDAVQDVFVEFLHEKGVLGHMQPGRSAAFRPLLFGVVRNIALRIEKARAAKLDSPGSTYFCADEALSNEEPLSRAFDRAWATSVMREALDTLENSARERGPDAVRRFELLRLVFDQALSVAEIATQWKVDADGLHKDLARARREFKQALREVVSFHHPEAPDAVERECRELLTLLE